MATKKTAPPVVTAKEWTSIDEIDRAVAKLNRRIADVEKIDAVTAAFNHTGEDGVLESNIRTTISEVFGEASHEFREHQYITFWAGPLTMGMGRRERATGIEQGRLQTITKLKGLIARLEEKKEDLSRAAGDGGVAKLDAIGLHGRIGDVADDLFTDGHHFEAVFAASKALVNYVKDRSGKHELDGVNLMRTVFSKNKPILAFNDLVDQTDQDEQEGMMHLFEGVVMAIRNPGGHAFPEGTERRAAEYLNLISLLAFKIQEAKKIRPA